jgi:hypothetical protein
MRLQKLLAQKYLAAVVLQHCLLQARPGASVSLRKDE